MSDCLADFGYRPQLVRLIEAEMLGYLVPLLHTELEDAEAIKAQLLEDGWQPTMQVRINGKDRTVSVGRERTRDLAFPIKNKGGTIIAGVPTAEEFQTSCNDVLSVFAGRFGLPLDTSKVCQWGTEPFDSGSDADWKVVWE